MPSGFLHGASRQVAAVSLVIVVVITASVWVTIWRYEAASGQQAAALQAAQVVSDGEQLDIALGDEVDGATRYMVFHAPADLQSYNAAKNVVDHQLDVLRRDTLGASRQTLAQIAAGDAQFESFFN